MGKTKGAYQAEFPVGSKVRVLAANGLLSFKDTWRLHNPLQNEQLPFAGKEGIIKSVGFYFGGDELYTIDGFPGVWHEQCLELPETKGDT